MRRRLFNTGVGVSLAIGLALGIVCGRSFWTVDQLTWWDAKSNGWLIQLSGGTLGVARLATVTPGGLVRNSVVVLPGWTWESNPRDNPAASAMGRMTAKGVGGQSLRPTFNNLRLFRGFGFASFIGQPLWLGILLAMVVPGIRLLRWTEDRALARQGKCVACGYDLRGSPPGGACPECGAASSSSQPRPL